MGLRGAAIDDQSTADNTPEDVAALYSWANLQGAKYRDYSASRREYRAQVRYRAAKAVLERELMAQAEAEASAEEAEREALAAEASARSEISDTSEALRIALLRGAEAAARKAAADRVEAARRAEAAARATMLALREEREMAEAHVSATLQASIYTESEILRRERAGPQPGAPIENVDAGQGSETGELDSESSGRFAPFLHPDSLQPADKAAEKDLAEASYLSLDLSREKALFNAEVGSVMVAWPWERVAPEVVQPSGSDVEGIEAEVERTIPAWLYTSPPPPEISQAAGNVPVRETQQDLRERVGARWIALKGAFATPGPKLPAIQAAESRSSQTPVLAVFSLAGGVGKTSLVATLGRALSYQGEKVVLTDTTSHGLLPFYFGARELPPGVVRSFPPLVEKKGEPISLVIYETTGKRGDEPRQQNLTQQILRNGHGNHRLLLDLPSGSSWLVREMADVHPIVLVPMAPDMTSVISLHAVERVFRGITDSDGRAVLPFYVLNQFDAALPLHVDVREVFRHQLGDRLLRFAIRSSPAVSEALAEGMTVVDYAPTAPVSQDYFDVALWLRDISPPATSEFRSLRWGER
jgi:cellulose synthase operon protein YhjQ